MRPTHITEGNLLYSKFTHLQVTLIHRNTTTDTSRIICTPSVLGMMASPSWQEINCHNQERCPWGAVILAVMWGAGAVCAKSWRESMPSRRNTCKGLREANYTNLTGDWGGSEQWYQEVSREDANGRIFFSEKEKGSWSLLHTPLYQTTNPQSHILLWEVGWKHFQAATQK